MHGCFAYCAGPKALNLQCGVEDAEKALVEVEKAPGSSLGSGLGAVMRRTSH